MKIVHLVAPARFGGLERVVKALAINQAKAGHDVTLAALLETGVPEPSLVNDLRNAGVHVIPVAYPARSFLSQLRSVREICKALEADVLHSHGYLPDVLSASMRHKWSAARVSTVHGFTGGGWRNRFYEWLQRRAYWRFDAVVAVSRKLALDLASSAFSASRADTVPNAWFSDATPLSRETARRKLNLAQDAFVVGWVGRLSEEKGPNLLLESLVLLPGVHAVYVGDGPERAALESKAAELRLQSRVSWFSAIDEASQFFSAFDVFVNSSRTEGTPITLFEAMNAEIPIVATSVGGVPDVVSVSEALLVPSNNPGALASAITLVQDNPAEAAVRAARARIRLDQDFAVAPWVAAYVRIYHDAVNSRGRS